MSKPHVVRITNRAANEIRKAASWWSQNRPAAPGAIREELSRVLDVIRHEPEIGARARNRELKGVRRIYLSRVRYYLYYRVNQLEGKIEVLAFWHSSRGSDPDL